jgi:MFS family permease
MRRGIVLMKAIRPDARWTGILSAVALIFFAVLQVGYVIGLTHRDEQPRNYDPFGYLGQARLFQEYGLIGGLDTSVRNPTAAYLIKIAKETDRDSSRWKFQIAPPAHHYEPRINRIVDRYPPGTGFFLHFYREGQQERSSQFVILTAVFLAIALCLWFANSLPKLLAVAVAGTLLVADIFREEFSYSVHLSLAFSAVIGLLGTLFFYRRGANQIAIAALLALLIGLSASIRVSNVLFIAGYLPIAWALLRSPDRAIGLPAAIVAGVIGFLPLAASQAINAGGVLHPTYPEQDSMAFSLDPATVLNELTLYFGGMKRYQLTNWLAVLAVAGAIVVGVYRRQRLFPILPAALNLATGVGFFALHSVFTPWYLLSNAIAALSGAAAFIWFNAGSQTKYQRKFMPHGAFGAVVMGLALLLSGYFFQGVKPAFDRNELAQKFANTDIVYACEAAGLFVESGIYAACLVGGDFEFTRKVLIRAAGDGRRQFIVAENPDAQALVARTCFGAEKQPFLTVAGFGVFIIPPHVIAPDCG